MVGKDLDHLADQLEEAGARPVGANRPGVSVLVDGLFG